MKETDEMTKLADAARTYSRTKKAHDAAAKAARDAVLEALRAGNSVPDVAAAGPFTYAYVRGIAEKNNIPRDERKARYPKQPRAELYEAVLLLPATRVDELVEGLRRVESTWHERAHARHSAHSGDVQINVSREILVQALADEKLTVGDL